jgi:hypothetical protein
MKLSLTASLDSPQAPTTGVTLINKPVHRVFVHTDVLQWLDDSPPHDQVAKRIRFNFQSLLAKGYAPNAKSVSGPLKGWRRALLGGTGGSHHYLWYVPASIDLGRQLGLPEGSVAVRERRHHDDFSAIDIGTLDDNYVELTPSDVEIGHSEQTPYTPQQVRIATSSESPITMLAGYPGSGKTTSLLLSALHSNAQKILYITYSEKLANEASQFFATFRPEGADIEVMTFNDLLDYLEDINPTSPRPATELARDLIGQLSKKPNLLKFLADQPDELYAELHSQAIGRALPIPFGDTPASPDDFLTEYEALRKPEVGQQMAQVVAQVINHMRGTDLVEEYFSPLIRARRNLVDYTEPPPPRLVGSSMILVDEVQDLTQIEALLLLNVCARIAVDSGQMPRIVLAGDESQTVRPTDFKWSWLKNLTTTVFGREFTPHDETLDVNLRSPKQIARFVEATRSQYSKFEKSDRPSGMTYTETNDTFVGRVMYCIARTDDDVNEILNIFQKIPRSCLVYPGYVAPSELTQTDLGAELVTSSEDVKGLDFSVVGLIDAGTRQQDLESLLQRRTGEPYVDVFGRTMADQYRVAASRACETLVLIDRNGNDNTDLIQNFCSTSKEEIELELIDAGDLAELLHEDVNQEDLIRSFIEEISQILDNQTERAILRSASLIKQMDRQKQTGEYDTSLNDEVIRIRAVAILSGLLHEGSLTRLDKDDLARESQRLMQQLDLGDSYESVLNLATEKNSWAHTRHLERLEEALLHLESVQRDLPEVFRRHEARILRWHDQILKRDTPVDKSKRTEILNVAHSIANSLGESHSYLIEQVDSIRVRWVADLMSGGSYNDALYLLEGRQVRAYEQEALCLTELKRYADASDAFLKAGLPEKAIESLRCIPDISGAMKLAMENESPSASTLKWIQDMRHLMTDGRQSTDSDLTEAEMKQLQAWLLSARKKSGKADDVAS